MRNAFAKKITSLARKNKRIVLLAGDIGNRLFDEFKENFPNRFYNCGVAEAHMTGLAAGLAHSGLIPVTYTIAPFNTFKCIEQIKIDICYQNLPVIIVGTGAGLSYSPLGATHQSLEDIAMLRSLPNINVLCPADKFEVESILEVLIKNPRPTYLRIGKKGEPLVHKKNIINKVKIGKNIIINKGKDIAIIGVGNMVWTALQCAKILETKGLTVSVESMHSVKPLDKNRLKIVFSKFKKIYVIEEHSLIGGAGSTILEFCNHNNISSDKVRCFGTPDKFTIGLGSQIEARKQYNLNAESIVRQMLQR